nr:Crp/Fnr family transcriptional regulator [Sphingomonas bacterium]
MNGLSPEDVSAIETLPIRERHFKAGTLIVAEGQLVSECCLLLTGYACGNKLTKDGGRQIVSFHVAGDILDIQHLFFERADHNLQVVTDADVAFISMSALRDLVRSNPQVATALWHDCLVDASIFREWVWNIGRRSAAGRISHMLCEFVARCLAAGLSETPDMILPMTQQYIGDATGLTSVHVNRVLRRLREGGLIEGAGRTFKIADWNGLRRFANFRPGYLHLAA